MNRHSSPSSDPWQGVHPNDKQNWSGLAVTRLLLGDAGGELRPAWAQVCGARVQNLRNRLCEDWVGLGLSEPGPNRDVKAGLTDWLVAGLIAREIVLLIGGPGTAKTEIATRTFQLLGLEEPSVDEDFLAEPLEKAANPRVWWREREDHERQKQKYFHYLLSRFTQPEELFGPIEIALLRQGFHVRVNFGLLTGAGVRAAFLDEVFKASSSILNTLLSLTNERRYPNWGAQQESDLLMFVGASNEMPGGYAGYPPRMAPSMIPPIAPPPATAAAADATPVWVVLGTAGTLIEALMAVCGRNHPFPATVVRCPGGLAVQLPTALATNIEQQAEPRGWSVRMP